MVACPASLVLLAGACFAAPLVAADDAYYISLPAEGAIYRLDATSGVMTPFVTGLGIPFYGAWSTTDGMLYMPDRLLGIVLRITPEGGASLFAAGGWLDSPVAVVQAPDGGLMAADIFTRTVVRLSATGQQTLVFDDAGAGGLLDSPGGIAYAPDGTLYVANNLSNTVVAIDEAAHTIAVACDSPLLSGPGGLVADGSGNLFVANYGSSAIVRIRLDTGAAEVFCNDPFLDEPNDLRLAHDGGLLVTMENSALGRIDALGQLTVISQAPELGAFDGVASPADSPPCDGAYLPYGTGTAGSAGAVPELRGIFSPCAGAAVAIDFTGFLGNAAGALAWGIAPADLPFKGSRLLVSIGPPGGLIPLPFPGSGPGGGALRLSFALPGDPAIAGLDFYLQGLAVDPGAAGGISASNGLREHIGG
ncbi:MAG TPA: hypothetical protein VK824_00495 [Planctomycetota bacterium]|nr:hypothetical protein [Planctomycetota bacterium]